MTASLAPGCSAAPGLCLLVEFRGPSDKYLPPFALASSAAGFRQLPKSTGLETYVIADSDLERLAALARAIDNGSGTFRISLFPSGTRRDVTPDAVVPWLRQVLAAAPDEAMRKRVVSYLARAGATP